MSATKIFSVFAVLVMLSSLLMSEAGTIHSSLGSGDTKNGWKPGGKRDFGGLDCQDLSSETLNFLFHTVNVSFSISFPVLTVGVDFSF